MQTTSKVQSKLAHLTSTVKSLAYNLWFDDIRITSAKPFGYHQDVTFKRIDAGLMDGLDWYTKERVTRVTNPESI